jgi:hypothetical protein
MVRVVSVTPPTNVAMDNAMRAVDLPTISSHLPPEATTLPSSFGEDRPPRADVHPPLRTEPSAYLSHEWRSWESKAEEDLVQRKFTVDRPNALPLTDITEHPAREGNVYCRVVLYGYGRKCRRLGVRVVERKTKTRSVRRVAIDQAARERLSQHRKCVALGGPAVA